MTDALITELSKIGALNVASVTSVKRFQDTEDTVPEIAQALRVDAVVRGSIVVVGDHVRVTTQLIDGATDQNLWAGSFDRDFANILLLHSEIARAVATEVRVVVTPEEARRRIRAAVDRGLNLETLTGYGGGLFFSLLGDLDRAFAALNDFENRDAFRAQIRVDPRLDLLRDDPRWDELMARMNFPGY